MQGPARRYEAGCDCWPWVSGRRGRLCPGAEDGQFWQGLVRFLCSLLPLPLPLHPRSQSWDAQVLEGRAGLSQNPAGVRNCWKQCRLLSYHQVFILLSHPSLLPPPPPFPIPGMVDFSLRMWLSASAATSQVFNEEILTRAPAWGGSKWHATNLGGIPSLHPKFTLRHTDHTQ